MKKALILSALLLVALTRSASAQTILAAGDIYAGTSSNAGTGVDGETFSPISVPDNDFQGDTNRTLDPTQIGTSGIYISGTYRTSQDQNSDNGKSYPAPYQADLSGYTGTGENGGTPEPLTLTLEGLTPNTEYSLIVYADEDTGLVYNTTFTNTGNTYTLSGQYAGVNGATVDPTEGQNYFRALETSDASGDITFNIASPGQYVAFNGITVESTVPEPSTYALLGAGLVGLTVALRVRNRRNQV